MVELSLKWPSVILRLLLISILVFIVSSPSVMWTLQPRTGTDHFKMGLPLYFYPNEQWQTVARYAQAIGIVIIDPSNGPGAGYNQDFSSSIRFLQAAGIQVIGYVSTGWGKTNLSQVEIFISDYYSWYHLNGIFVDEVNTTCASAPYYASLYNHVKSMNSSDLVVLNPGTNTDKCFAAISDILVTFEGSYLDYINNYPKVNWTAEYPAGHFWHVIYDASSTIEMRQVVQLATERNAYWVYVTNKPASENPQATLPSYFCQEARATNYPNSPCP